MNAAGGEMGAEGVAQGVKVYRCAMGWWVTLKGIAGK